MPQIHKIDIDPVNVDTAAIAASQTPGSGGAQSLTLVGGSYTSANGDATVARQIGVTSDNNDVGRTFTVTGTDADGKAQTEGITGPSGGIRESVKYWLTVSSVAVDADTAGAIIVGTVDELSTNTIPINRHSDFGAMFQLSVTASINVTVQVTFQDINQRDKPSSDQESIDWINTGTAALVSASGSLLGRIEAGVNAYRVIVNSHGSGGEIQAYVSQERN